MNALNNALKAEIARIARKEFKDELIALRKLTTLHRSEIAALKRALKDQSSELKALKRGVAAAVPATKAATLDGAGDGQSAPKVKFTAAKFAALREKFALTKAQMAQLLQVSSITVHKWETGVSQPRVAQLDKIVHAMKLGKRQAHAALGI